MGPRDDGCDWLPIDREQAGLDLEQRHKGATEISTAVMNKRNWRSRSEGQMLQAM